MDFKKPDESDKAVYNKISKDRQRTNILKKYEQAALVFFVQRIPSWMTSNMLTGIGVFGTVITVIGFILATYISRYYLLLGIIGFAVNWFGDSLDGRVAYYRCNPRKWYGKSLDITVDWFTTFLIGLGFIIYTEGLARFLGFVFVAMYGWEMITTLLRYKVIDEYTIDKGILGPTEVRVVISTILILEVIFKGSIVYCAMIACVILFFENICDTRALLKSADARDKAEKQKADEQKS